MFNLIRHYYVKWLFERVAIEFYEDFEESYLAGESVVSFLKNEAKREILYDSKSRGMFYLALANRIESFSATSREGFSYAIQSFISPIEATILSAFQKSGNFGQGLRVVRGYKEKINQIKELYFKAFAWPIFSLLVSLGSVSFMADKFVLPDPKFRPWIGVAAHGYANFVRDNLLLILMSIICCAMVISWRLPRGSGEFRYRILDQRLPPFTSYRTFQSSAFMLVLNALMMSGMLISDAIDEAVSKGGDWMAGYLYLIKAKLQNADQKSTVDALNVGFFDQRIMLRLEASAAIHGIEASLEKLSDQGFRKILKQSRASSAVFGQAILAFAGFSIVFVMAGMLEMAFALRAGL